MLYDLTQTNTTHSDELTTIVGCSRAAESTLILVFSFCLSVGLCQSLFRLELRNYGAESDETWWLGPLGGEWLLLRELAP